MSREKTFILADFNPVATGCTIAATDLVNGKRLWRTRLKGTSPVEHASTRHSNAINMEVIGEALIIRGNESSGRYVEILDIKTGKTVGHRVYR